MGQFYSLRGSNILPRSLRYGPQTARASGRDDKSISNLIAGDSELGFAVRRLVVGAIRGLQDQPIVPRR